MSVCRNVARASLCEDHGWAEKAIPNELEELLETGVQLGASKEQWLILTIAHLITGLR